jgi:hypothetical protein
MKTETCVLSDGRRVKYSLKQREGRDPFYLVVFRGADGKRKERSSGEANQKRAKDSAVAIIVRDFEPRMHSQRIGWDEAVEKMAEAMRGKNLRPNTVSSYRFVIKTFRDAFPGVDGPSVVTTEMAKQYKIKRLETCKPETVKGDLNELSIVFGKWWVKE